jgi:flagellar motor switch protein FliM
MMQVEQHPEGGASIIRLFDKAAFSAARYPRLQAVFERMVATSLDSLREVCPVPPQYAFKEVQTEALGDVLDVLNDDAVVAIFMVREWESRILVAVDRAYVNAITEVLFGGDGFESAYEEKRKFSQIEKNVARAAMLSAAKALQTSLAPLADLTITFERIETNIELISLDDPKSQAVVAKFEFRSLGRTGELRVVIPQATIRAARTESDESVEKGGAAQSELARKMHDEIQNTDVRLSAVLEERRMTLAELASLRVGQVLPLEARVDGRIKLICNNEPLLLCEIGQSEGTFALRVDQVLERQGRIGA